MRRRYLPAATRTHQPSADPEVVAAVDAVVAAYMSAAEEVVDLSRVDDALVPVVHGWTLPPGRDTDFLNSVRSAERLLATASTGPGTAWMTVGDPLWSSPSGELASAPALWHGGGRDGLAYLSYADGDESLLTTTLADADGGVPIPVGGRSVLRPTAARPVAGGDAEVPLLFSAGRTGEYQVHVVWPGRRPTVSALDAGPALNQEAVVGYDGVVTTVFQLATGGRYLIAVAEASRTGWTSPTVISTSEDHNAWDPCLVMGADGALWAVWCAFRAGRYVIVARCRDVRGGWGPAVCLTPADGVQRMHPSITLSGDRLLVAYDAMRIPGHGLSGRTRFRRREDVGRPDEPAGPFPFPPRRSSVGVLAFDGAVAEELSTTGLPHAQLHRYPRLAVDASGRVWLSFRVLRALPLRNYFFQAVLAVWDRADARWRTAVLPASAAHASEVPLIASGQGVTAAWVDQDLTAGFARRRHLTRHDDCGVRASFGGSAERDLDEHIGAARWSAGERSVVRVAQATLPTTTAAAGRQDGAA